MLYQFAQIPVIIKSIS